ncbi:hypothetical protein [Crystallibacter degradans]|uniref:hypothetical protein n=1 Tax=Crystallibacter degradans TaxID=2726743 RepID=UPI00147578FE|nr:hypothetical protein [Arthrobacter sp. SF27]NMR28612.1 hypothetical protein [Arthrobacter sp. SF27]
MTEQRNLSDAVEPTVAAVVCLPVRRTTGGMDGMKLLSVATVIWLIASAIAGVPGAVCILILILLLTLAGLGFLKLRKRSITRYETTVNEALHRDLHSNLRISYFRASLLRAGQLIRLQDGS